MIPVVGAMVALLSAGISEVLEQVAVLACIPRWVPAAVLLPGGCRSR